MRFPSANPLLALVNVSAEWHAGLPTHCSARVRVLDRVQLAVYAGDCVVVHHHDPAGARVLLAALGGHPALAAGHRLSGERRCAPGVRIRRCAIGPDIADTLQEEWQPAARVGTPGGTHGSNSGPVVHLMRVSRRRSLAGHESRQWRAWARHECRAGGALVLVARPDTLPAPPGRGRHYLSGEAAAGRRELPAMREGAAPAYAGTAPLVTAVGREVGLARELLLHHGRLLTLRRWD